METLCLYAKKCESVFETGVRGVVSSWAFAKGLLDNRSNSKKFCLMILKSVIHLNLNTM